MENFKEMKVPLPVLHITESATHVLYMCPDVERLPASTKPEKLGRQRPECFPSLWSEGFFCFSILISVITTGYFLSGFQTLLPTVSVELAIPQPLRTWPSSALSLVAAATLLPLGRAADMYGTRLVFHAGFAWLALWSLAGGFSPSYQVLILTRAMAGLGAAAVLPAGIGLLGKAYRRPGPRKNFVFSLYGSVALVGFFIGIVAAGATAETLSWRWFFWIGAVVGLVGCGVSLAGVSRAVAGDKRNNGDLRMDWWGVCTSVPGLGLVVFAFTDSASSQGGWTRPSIWSVLVVGLAFLAATIYVEGWVAEFPLIPLEIFRARHMGRMMVGLFILWGVWSIFLFYTNFYIENVIGITPLQTAVWYSPWAIGGVILAITSGTILHIVPGRVLLILAGASQIVAVLLFALMPVQSGNVNYWAWVFPAMLAETLSVDTLYTVSNVFITTSLPSHLQSLAGAIINSLVFLGSCFFLGVADVAVQQAPSPGVGVAQSYKVAFWVGVVASALGLVVLGTVDLPRARNSVDVEKEEEISCNN